MDYDKHHYRGRVHRGAASRGHGRMQSYAVRCLQVQNAFKCEIQCYLKNHIYVAMFKAE